MGAIADLKRVESGAIADLPSKGEVVTTDQADARSFRATAGEFRKGLRSTAISIGAGVEALIGQAGQMLGLNEFAADRYQAAKESVKFADLVGPAVTDYAAVKDFTSAVNFGAGILGSAAASAVPMIAAGVALRRPVAPIVAGSGIMGAGETALNTESDPVAAARSPGTKLGISLAAGGAMGLLDTLGGEGRVVRQILSPGQRAKNLGTALGKASLSEAATEAGQGAIGLGAHTSLNPDRDKSGDAGKLLNDAIAGGVGGAGMGAAGHAVSALPSLAKGSKEWYDERMKRPTVDTIREDLGAKDAPIDPDPEDVPEELTSVEDISEFLENAARDGKEGLKKAWEAGKDKWKDLGGWEGSAEKTKELYRRVKKDYIDTEVAPRAKAMADGIKDFVEGVGQGAKDELAKGKTKKSLMRSKDDEALFDLTVGSLPADLREAYSPEDLMTLVDNVKLLANRPGTKIPRSFVDMFGDKSEDIIVKAREIFNAKFQDDLGPEIKRHRAEGEARQGTVQDLIRGALRPSIYATPELRAEAAKILTPRLMDYVNYGAKDEKRMRQELISAFGGKAGAVLAELETLRDKVTQGDELYVHDDKYADDSGSEDYGSDALDYSAGGDSTPAASLDPRLEVPYSAKEVTRVIRKLHEDYGNKAGFYAVQDEETGDHYIMATAAPDAANTGFNAASFDRIRRSSSHRQVTGVENGMVVINRDIGTTERGRFQPITISLMNMVKEVRALYGEEGMPRGSSTENRLAAAVSRGLSDLLSDPKVDKKTPFADTKTGHKTPIRNIEMTENGFMIPDDTLVYRERKNGKVKDYRWGDIKHFALSKTELTGVTEKDVRAWMKPRDFTPKDFAIIKAAGFESGEAKAWNGKGVPRKQAEALAIHEAHEKEMFKTVADEVPGQFSKGIKDGNIIVAGAEQAEPDSMTDFAANHDKPRARDAMEAEAQASTAADPGYQERGLMNAKDDAGKDIKVTQRDRSSPDDRAAIEAKYAGRIEPKRMISESLEAEGELEVKRDRDGNIKSEKKTAWEPNRSNPKDQTPVINPYIQESNNRLLGNQLREDIEGAKIPFISKAVRWGHETVLKGLDREDAFGGAKVIYSDKLDSRVISAATAWAKRLKLPQDVVIMSSQNLAAVPVEQMMNVRRAIDEGANGLHMFANNRSYIVLNHNLTSDPADALTTLAHEMGHAFDAQILSTEGYEAVRSALKLKFTKTLVRAIAKEDYEGFLLNRVNVSSAKELLTKALAEGTSLENFAKDVIGHDMDIAMLGGFNYTISFTEWWAEQVAKFMTGEQKPQDKVDVFFAEVAQTLREFFEEAVKMIAELTGRKYTGRADPRVREFFDYWENNRDLSVFVEEARKDYKAQPSVIKKYFEQVAAQPPIKGFNFSKVGLGKRQITEKQKKAVRAYVEKVLGKEKTNVVFAKMAEAGSFIEDDDGVQTLRISIAAIDPMSVAYHEALHGLMAKLAQADPKAAELLKRVSTSPTVMAQLHALLKRHPEARKQLSDPEEAAAYMYQFWAAGKLEVGPRADTMFGRIKNYLKTILGYITGTDSTPANLERARRIFEAFHSGELADRSTVAKVLNERAPQAYDAVLKEASGPIFDTISKIMYTADGRIRSLKMKPLDDLVDRFHTPIDNPGKGQGYVQVNMTERQRRINAWTKDIGQVDDKIMREALEALQLEDKADLSKLSKEAKKVYKATRQHLDELFDYQIKAGVKRLKLDGKYEEIAKRDHYFPQVWDANYVEAHQQEFAELLLRHGYDPTLALRTILRDNQAAKPSEDDMHAGITYFHPATQKRVLVNLPREEVAKFLEKDLGTTMLNYIARSVRRAEYTRRFDNSGEKIEALIGEARKLGLNAEQEKSVRMAVQAMEGSLSPEMSRDLKAVWGGLMTYQNIRLLPLALFSNIVDPLGILVRGGELKDVFDTYKRGLQSLYKAAKAGDDGYDMAAAIGAISAAHDYGMMSEMYGMQFVKPWQRKANDFFFKYNGMEGWNQANRIGATMAAEKFIIRHATKPTEHSERYLRELGLTAAQVKQSMSGGHLNTADQKITQALNTWVDSAIIRPNAAIRPVWMSDPMWMLVSHLKQFTYAFQKVIIARVAHEASNGNMQPLGVLLSFVPMMIAADMLKVFLTPQGDDDKFRANWGAADWIWSGLQRAGIFGPAQWIIDPFKPGYSAASLAGPTVQQLADLAGAIGGDGTVATQVGKAVPGFQVFGNMGKE